MNSLSFTDCSAVGAGARRAFTCRSKRTTYPAHTHLSFQYSRPISFPSFSCSATLSAVAEVEQKQTFNADTAALLVKEIRMTFNTGTTKSYEWRVSQLTSILRFLVEKEKDIIEALHKDLARAEHETFISEISMVKSSCEHALKELKDWMTPEEAKVSLSTIGSSAEIVSEPLGVALVISTWNYPFLLSIDPVIGAISAGNAVVLKPSELAPATSSLLARLLDEYLDKSAIRVVEGAVPETTLLLDQKWDKIFYTGSPRVGRIVMAAAAKHLTPVVLELGGKCPAVIDSNIDLEVAVRRIIAGKWACNNGQACIGVDYVITTKKFAPKLIDALKKGLEQSLGRDPMESKDICRIVNLVNFNRLMKLLDEDKVYDKIVYGGQRNERQLRIAPTILLDVPEDSMIMNEEIFGPLLPILTVDKIKDSFDLIKSRPKPLAAYLFTNDEQLKKDYVQNISSGGMLINDTIIHLTVPSLPFGGVGESGMGSYHGKYSFDAFSHKKSVLYRSFSGDLTLRYPPYSSEKLKLLKDVFSGNIFAMISALVNYS